MYKLTKLAVMQMLNKESVLVRYKTQLYIEALENRLKEKSLPSYHYCKNVLELNNTKKGSWLSIKYLLLLMV